MKPLKNIQIYFFVLGMILHFSVHAQTMAPFSIKSTESSTFLTGEKSAFKSNIHSKAIRHFHNKYKNDMQESWSQVIEGFMAKFINKGIITREFYTTKGLWVCTITDYNENQTPNTVTDLVKDLYSGYRVTHVSEIEFFNSKASMVNIHNGIQFRVLRIVDGEVELLKDYVDLKK